MEKEFFFSIYLTALDSAINNDNINYGYQVRTLDWYIDDDKIRNEVDLFEQENYENYKEIFESVAFYFDAKSHYFKTINGIEIDTYRIKLKQLIDEYKLRFCNI